MMITISLWSNYRLSGTVYDMSTGKSIANADVYNRTMNQLVNTDENGFFEMTGLTEGVYQLVFLSFEYETQEKTIYISGDTTITIQMDELLQELTEVVVSQKREELFSLKRLMPVEGTSIYAGKKTEVVLLDQMVGNAAVNNSRQIYSQVVGLNIYESVDGGLQVNIGGRGLDPNRTANFNTRQNGYDISADVLGYPESYYTPPAEALKEIQVVRGAASLQYGTQFGGLINFKMKSASKKPIEFVSRQSIASFGFFNTFNSLSGTKGKFSYYTYFNYKTGNGYRDNSDFDSKNVFGSFSYAFSEKTKLTFEATYLHYLAKQAGGLTDTQFNQDPTFTNRTRNWFEVDWRLAALKLEHKFSTSSDLSLTLFGLDAGRSSLGFRGNPSAFNVSPITQVDEQNEDGTFIYPRDLIKGKFQNWGAEAKYLKRYQLGEMNAVFLVGAKYYHATNTSIQGPGSDGVDADFSFKNSEFPDFANQSNFTFPNRNLALFGEHILFLTDRLTITPGVRIEYIKTESAGIYSQINFDNAGNPIANTTLEDNRTLDRSFLLFGIGASYEPIDNLEVYMNITENYRSVTFSDIRVVNPSFIVDPDIADESGYTFDLGLRGKWKNKLSYDIGGFGLLYDDRIGIVLDNRANRVRKNIGKALIYGLEVFSDINVLSMFDETANQTKLNWFFNLALTNSQYISSQENNVEGKKVEFIPAVNMKTGLQFGYRNFLGSFQYTYLSKQFTDVENSSIPLPGDVRNGLIGEIPAYGVLDLSFSYAYRKMKIETGVNNLLNEKYFTRRATGYPGPGIIPSDPKSYYLTIQLKL